MSPAAPPPSLRVELAGLRLKNPVLTASGTCGYGVDLLPFFDIAALGGIVTKSLSLDPREGNPPCRIEEVPGGLLNSIGLQNIGVGAFLEEKLPLLRRHDTAVVASIFGESEREFAELARRLDGAAGVSALELNVSCPNTARGGVEFGVDAEATSRVTAAVKEATRLPVIVKLSPNVTDITVIARAAVDAGADALSLVNSCMGMAVDVERRRPVLSSGSGGLTGPAIKAMAVHLLRRVARAVKAPLIGIGGIRGGEDALEYILAGASAVQVGTATFTEPAAALRVAGEIESYCIRHRVADVRDLVGALRDGAEGAAPSGG